MKHRYSLNSESEDREMRRLDYPHLIPIVPTSRLPNEQQIENFFLGSAAQLQINYYIQSIYTFVLCVRARACPCICILKLALTSFMHINIVLYSTVHCIVYEGSMV
jgi:hypothetical protein